MEKSTIGTLVIRVIETYDENSDKIVKQLDEMADYVDIDGEIVAFHYENCDLNMLKELTELINTVDCKYQVLIF